MRTRANLTGRGVASKTCCMSCWATAARACNHSTHTPQGTGPEHPNTPAAAHGVVCGPCIQQRWGGHSGKPEHESRGSSQVPVSTHGLLFDDASPWEALLENPKQAWVCGHVSDTQQDVELGSTRAPSRVGQGRVRAQGCRSLNSIIYDIVCFMSVKLTVHARMHGAYLELPIVDRQCLFNCYQGGLPCLRARGQHQPFRTALAVVENRVALDT